MSEGERATAARRVGRRTIVKAALVGAVTVSLGGLLVRARTSVYAYAPRAPLRAFSAWHAVVVEAVAARVVAPDRRGDPNIPTPADLDVVGFVDGYVAGLPADLRRDFLRLLAFVEHLAPLRAGLTSRFSGLGPDDQDRVLLSLERSAVPLLARGFDALKSCVFMGYYRHPRAWAIAGYDGPLVGRPAGGFR